MAILLLPIIVALLLLGSVTPVPAEPISSAIFLTAAIETVVGSGIVIGGATITAGAIGGAIVSGALAIGASLLSAALAPKTADNQPATPSGVQTSVRFGADVPRNRVFGKQMLAGQLVYWNTYGEDNRWLQLVFVLGSGPHDLFRVFGDGKPLTLGAHDGTGFPLIEYNYYGPTGQPLAWVNFHTGFDDQAVDDQLVANATPAGRWSATNTGKGVCYARMLLFFWPEIFPNGIPQFTFEVGARCYDPRKDSTNGGVGPHLWSNPHTWEWSDNPAVCLYNFQRGLFIAGQRVLGRGLAPVDMIRAMYIDAANVCDENVLLKDGFTTEKRYRVGMIAGADRDLKSVEQDLTVAMAGSLVEVGGAWGPLAGAVKEVAATITDDDFVTGKVIRFSQKKSRDQLVNALFGSYTDPAQNYQAIPYTPRTSSADEADDGDRYQVRRDYVQVQSETQAQRIGEIERRDARFQGSAGGTLPFKYSFIEAGDWIRWQSTRRNFDKYFRVKSHRLAVDQTIEVALDETHPDVFDFDPAIDQLDPLNPGDLPGIGALISTVPDFAVGTLQLDGAGTLTTPALVATWSPIQDRTVDGVLVQYRIGTNDDTIKVTPFFPPADGEGVISDGIVASTAYQARATITTTPARPVFWTEWIPAVSGFQVVQSALTSTPIDFVTLQMFEAGLRHYVATELQTTLEQQSRFEQLIASVATEQEAQNRLELIDMKNADVTTRGQVSAISGGHNWRGTYSDTAHYNVNDMVRLDDGRLFYTTAETIGVAPPAAPWVEEFTAAIVSEEWRTFAGPDGVAAQTSDLIEARFKGGPIGSTANDLEQSVSQIISQWKVFAGPDWTAAQTSQEIQSAFTAIDATTGDLTDAVATIDSQWKTFAGADGAAASTSDLIEARFKGGPVGGTANDLEQSVAQVITNWKAFAGTDFATAQSEQTTLAQISGNTTSITTNATAIATVDGKLLATYQITLDTNGYISGLKLYNDGSTSLFAIATDKFLVSRPGVGGTQIPIFEIGTSGGAGGQIVMKGNILADGTITAAKIDAGQVQAIHVGTNTIIAHAANIDNLVVDNIHIRGAAITVPLFQSGGNVTFAPFVDHTLGQVVIPFQGVAGSTATLNFQASCVAITKTAGDLYAVSVDGADISTCQPGNNSAYPVGMVGGVNFTCTGGAQTKTVRFHGSGGSGINDTGAANCQLFACVYLR